MLKVLISTRSFREVAEDVGKLTHLLVPQDRLSHYHFLVMGTALQGTLLKEGSGL